MLTMTYLVTTATVPIVAFLLVLHSPATDATSPTPPPSVCNDIVNDCNLHTTFIILRGFPDAIDMDANCNRDDFVRQCFGYGDCLAGRTEKAPALQVFNYLCEPSRRNEMKAATRLSCLQDEPALYQRMEEDLRSCVIGSMTPAQRMQFDYDRVMAGRVPETTGPLCPNVNSVISCLVVKTEEFCGPEMVPVIRDVIDIVADFFTDLIITGCNRHTGIVRDVESVQ